MWSRLFLLFLTTVGLVAADCDEDACNIGISASVGAADVCSAVAGIFCGETFGIGCAVSLGCGIAGTVALAGKSACGKCGEGGGGPIPVLVRKEVGNPATYFDKSFREYQDGFSANGESWLGLDELHRLTSEASFGLKIVLTDFGGKRYTAFYDNFKIGPGESYSLSVGGFNATLSTLGDSMKHNNGQNFSTRDRDQYRWSDYHCAKRLTGGWWYAWCTNVHITGQHTDRRTTISGDKQIYYYHGGERGDTKDSWAEAEMVLVPN